MRPYFEHVQALTRRRFLSRAAAVPLGAAALEALLGGRSARAASPFAPKLPGHRPRARHVIYLHMEGGPSHVDLLDPKPLLARRAGEQIPDEMLQGREFAFIRNGVASALPSPFAFAQHGESGLPFSELLENIARCADDLCVIRSMHSDQFNHGPAQLLMYTGSARRGAASIGSWVTYGLGSENQNVPGYIVLVSGGKSPIAGPALWGAGFLPSVYQGVQCRNVGDPILYLADPPGVSRETRRDALDVLRGLNLQAHRELGDEDVLTRIEQYELAYRMQVEVPQLMDISREPQHILDLYGAVPGAVPTRRRSTIEYPGDEGPIFANNCLLARRLIEAGVRFVHLYDWGWDHHGVVEGQSIQTDLPKKCRQVDQPVAALLIDLKQRGLLDETLVIWGGEFGRTPMAQKALASSMGRDHHPYAFSLWMAGGGIKGGHAIGQTDEFGFLPVADPVHAHDLQATILYLLGLDPYRLTYRSEGLDHRLIGPDDEPRVLVNAIA
jgi:hypothetical protein